MGLHLETFDVSQVIEEMVTTLQQQPKECQLHRSPPGGERGHDEGGFTKIRRYYSTF